MARSARDDLVAIFQKRELQIAASRMVPRQATSMPERDLLTPRLARLRVGWHTRLRG
jgi:hypothetical protein